MPTPSRIFAIVTMFAATGCATMDQQIKASGTMGPVDSAYVDTAYQLEQLDDQAGKLAARKASDPRVADLANQLVAQVDVLTPALQGAMKAEGVAPPASLPPDEAAEIDKLRALSGPAFDKEFLTDELALHQRAAQVFAKEDAETKDGALRAQVETELPALQDNLTKIQILAGNAPPPPAPFPGAAL